MLEAREIMNKDLITVHIDTPIYEAMNILIEKKISGIPVVDKQNHLLGIITEKDMINLLVGKIVGEDHMVGEYMTKEVKFFNPRDSAIVIAEFFLNTPVRRVPIVENGTLVGVISRRDIIFFILTMRGKMQKK